MGFREGAVLRAHRAPGTVSRRPTSYGSACIRMGASRDPSRNGPGGARAIGKLGGRHNPEQLYRIQKDFNRELRRVGYGYAVDRKLLLLD